MTLKMSLQIMIRRRFLDGESVSKIATDFGIDPKTVRKYAAVEDFSPKPPVVRHRRFACLDPWKEFIDGLLEANQGSWRKHRLTAKRVWDLAREQGCTVSQSTVERYVKQWRAEHRAEHEPMLELQWNPGEAQVDFGELDVLETGRKVRRYFLVLSLPYSNMAWAQLFGGQTAECVTQGLADVFERLGGVPSRIVVDNATGIGRRIADKIVTTELYQRFSVHYGFETTFCNPASGNEKGNVENKVGYLRRNLFTPEIEITTMAHANQALFEQCENLQFDTVHYKLQRPIRELLVRDRQSLRPLPRAKFNAVTYQQMRTDRYGGIRLEGHHYSGDPHRALADVVVARTAHQVILTHPVNGQVIATHQRLWEQDPYSSTDLSSQIKVLSFKGRGWKNTAVRSQLPDRLVAYLDALPQANRRQALSLLAQCVTDYGPEATFQAVTQLPENPYHMDLAALTALAARIKGYGIDQQPLAGPDLSIYDQLGQAS